MGCGCKKLRSDLVQSVKTGRFTDAITIAKTGVKIMSAQAYEKLTKHKDDPNAKN